ncbi:hypothetical protein QBZ16_003873 [Prototheca wickerhamii]|uniref:UspA domain-containing protein n=1 Tax=Prototheca wickerhamii TaxID=3111 RepID=A0AAD9IJW9_PROWI|nr:hypothetical protein QBZ16_003873 [Prototheca wickerhamii]
MTSGSGITRRLRLRATAAEEEIDSAKVGPHRTLLFSVDGTKDAEEGLRWAVKHLTRKGDTIHLVHVLADPRTPFSGLSRASIAGTWTESPDLEHIGRQERDALGMLNSRFVSIVRAAGLEGHASLLRLRTGKSAASIGELVADAAVRLGGSLLLIPSHGPGIMADYGSVARWCQDHSHVPVVLLPPAVLQAEGDAGPSAGPTVVVAGPAGADLERLHKAFSFAARRVAQQGDEIKVINVVAGPPDEGALAAERRRSARRRRAGPRPCRPIAGSASTRTSCATRPKAARAVVLLRHGDDLASQLQFAPLTLHTVKSCSRPLVVLEPERNLAPLAPPGGRGGGPT